MKTVAASSLKSLFGRLEGLFLLLVAGYLAWLLGSDNYWQMLNPRFAWLSGLACAGLLLAGAALLAAPVRSSLLRLGSWGVFCTLMAATLWGPQGMALTEEKQSSPFELETPETLPPLLLDGQEYTRISTAELLNLLEKDPQGALQGHWALRGVVGRSPELDQQGLFALLRPFIWCCLADGVAVGFLVPHKEVDSLQTGQWVRVAGRLEASPAAAAGQGGLSLGSFYVALDERHILQPAAGTDEALQHIEPPSMPYVFSVRESAPFSW